MKDHCLIVAHVELEQRCVPGNASHMKRGATVDLVLKLLVTFLVLTNSLAIRDIIFGSCTEGVLSNNDHINKISIFFFKRSSLVFFSPYCHIIVC